MNTREIEHILRSHAKTAPIFLGAVPSDGIPQSDIYPYAVVINTEPHNDGGRHWVAVFVESKDRVEYFDSFGVLPNSNIASFLLRFPHVMRITERFQSLTSTVCGHYCIFFLTKRCSRRSFAQIVKALKAQRPRTDRYVATYVSDLVR
jgi:hypothetical protein